MNVAQPVTRYEIAAWGLTGAALVLVLSLHLLSALLGGLLVYQLVHLLHVASRWANCPQPQRGW